MGTVSQDVLPKHNYCGIILLVLICVEGYPNGAPSCNARTGHGRNRGVARASVTNIGGNSWEVTVPTSHKGLVINALSQGQWNGTRRGYQNRGSCVTHSNRSNKGFTSFTFRATGRMRPMFSGYLVYDYSSYSR